MIIDQGQIPILSKIYYQHTAVHWWLPTVLLKRDEGVDILTCTSIHRKIRSILGIVIVAQKVMRWYFLSTAKEGGGKNGHF